MKKFLSFFLVFCFLFTFSFYSFAADDIETINLNYKVFVDNLPDGDNATSFDVTNNTQVQYVASGRWKGFIKYVLPLSTIHNSDRILAYMVLDDNFSVNTEHEYNINFDYGVNIALPYNLVIRLAYYDVNGTFINEHIIANVDHAKTTAESIQSIDVDFVPDTENITSGFKCKLEIIMVQTGFNHSTINQIFYFSSNIGLTDKDDNSSWFQKIIDKISDVWESIKSIPNEIGNRINELKENITLIITDLKDNLLDGLKNLFIPSENYFNDKLTELQIFFDDKFGVFALPFTLLIRILQLYNNVGNGSGILHLKEFKIDNNIFWNARDINLKQLILDFSQELYNDCGIDLYEIYLAFIDVIILFAFVRLIKNKYEKMLGTGAFDMPKDIMNERGKASNVDNGGHNN